jgi:hypothetical protein
VLSSCSSTTVVLFSCRWCLRKTQNVATHCFFSFGVLRRFACALIFRARKFGFGFRKLSGEEESFPIGSSEVVAYRRCPFHLRASFSLRWPTMMSIELCLWLAMTFTWSFCYMYLRLSDGFCSIFLFFSACWISEGSDLRFPSLTVQVQSVA